MSETKNITEKLLEARRLIKEIPIKKGGKNTFSKYDYFTPSQVSELVNDVCQELKMVPVFSLCKDKYGLYGQLEIIDLDGKPGADHIKTQMRTEMPSITATNMTQQMGGCETYTKRYMLMSAFDITDNNLDFDSQDNRPKKQELSDLANETDPMQGIILEVEACTEQKQLSEMFTKLSKADQEMYRTIFNNRREALKIRK